MKWLLLFLNLFIFGVIYAQSDSIKKKPQLYRDNVVLCADHGFNSGPFSLHYQFTPEVNRLSYKHNLKPLIGLGIQYKWFGLRIGFSLPGNYRPVSRFGESEYFDLGFNINSKRNFWDFDIHVYNGYVIKNAYYWNDTLNALDPNLPMLNMSTASFSINNWHFRSKNYRMTAVQGINDEFTGSQETWYFKSTFNVFGADNDNSRIVPFIASDSTDGRPRAVNLYAIDLGLVPGYAYTVRKNYWQASVFGGLGGVLQAKAYTQQNLTRAFLGLAPRVDFRFVAGYSNPKYFVWFTSDFDIKSIRFKEFRYVQTYYQLRIMAGVRLNNRKKG